MTVILTTASTGAPVGMGTWGLVANLTLFQLGAGVGQIVPTIYTANVYRQTTDELVFKSVISTQR